MKLLSVKDAKKLYFKQIRNLTLNEISERMYQPEDIKTIFRDQVKNIESNNKIKVLVVDDEPHIVSLIKLSLDANKFEVIEAFSGTEAIELAIKEQPDIITLDVMMPGMDGFNVCKRLKNIPATSGIPVMMISVKDMLQDKFDGIDSGAIDYLTKPFDPEELSKKIEANLK